MTTLISQTALANLLDNTKHPGIALKEVVALHYGLSETIRVQIPTAVVQRTGVCYPCADSCFSYLQIDPWEGLHTPSARSVPIRDTRVSVYEVFPSGEIKTKMFINIDRSESKSNSSVRDSNLEAESEFHLLTARLYSCAGPSFIHVPTTYTVTPPLRTFPYVEAILKYPTLQPHIHHIDASLHHRLPSGRLECTEFLCFFKRHKRLPRNPGLNIQGEVLIMRAGDDGEMVANMLEAEADLADLVARASVFILFPSPH
ncbi:hypothetical protein R3P38DRAFT_3175569 [Favolaschia claudopus]|uniref:Uncharacterized protein n=1 Tax=Favolaschia claudopus TaxID=2862362 RepID=A0AAW0D3Z4_9AGAR